MHILQQEHRDVGCNEKQPEYQYVRRHVYPVGPFPMSAARNMLLLTADLLLECAYRPRCYRGRVVCI
jgi:hypothetical protein